MIVALDTETALIETGNLAPELACVSLAFEHMEPVVVPHDDPSLEGKLAALFGDKDVVIVGQNIAYDMAVLWRAFPKLQELIWGLYCANRITDTMLREQLTHIAGGVYRGYDTGEGFQGVEYTLEALAKRHLGVQLDKNSWRLSYGELRSVSFDSWPEGAIEYPKEDARCTLGVFLKQECNKEYLEDQYRQTRAAFWLHLCSVWGICTDAKAVDALEEIWKKEYVEAGEFLQKHGLLDAKGSRKTKIAKAIMVEVFPSGPTTPTGEPSLAHQACIDSGDERLLKYAEYAGYQKKFSNDLPMLRRGVVQSRYRSLVESGRTSSEKPNIQNLPRKPGVRECFVPRPGHVFAVCDYSGFELHTWSQACIDLLGHSRLAEALSSGRDPHADVAAALGFTREMDGFKEARQVGKVANFGFPGGLGVGGFRAFALSGYGQHLDEETAGRIRKAWQSAWPECFEYFDRINRMIQGNGAVEQLRSKRFRGNLTFCQACNTLFQGLAADAAKDAGFEISRRCYNVPTSALYGSRIVVFVHDEFIVETPEEYAHEAAMELSDVMVSVANRWTPDVPNKAEALLCRRWSKNAKTVTENGRLIPWDL